MPVKQHMKTELLKCGDSYIRSGQYKGRTMYLLLDVLGFFKTVKKGSEIVSSFPESYTERCAIHGIPGRPNICITLKGLTKLHNQYDSLAEMDMALFIVAEEAKVVAYQEECKAEQAFEELVEVIDHKEEWKKINKRLKHMEKMLTVIHKELI